MPSISTRYPIRVTIIGRIDRPARAAWRCSQTPRRKIGRPKIPGAHMPIRPAPTIIHLSARRCASRDASSCSSRLTVPPDRTSRLTTPTTPGEGHVQLDPEHRQQVAVDDDLQDDECPLALAFLLIHVS